MSIVTNQAPEANNFGFSKPEIQHVQTPTKNYISPEKRTQPRIKMARINSQEDNRNILPKENLISQDLRSYILRSIWTATAGCINGTSGGICEVPSYLFEVPSNVKEGLSYDQERMSRWCKAKAWNIIKGATYNIGGFYLNLDYKSIRAESQDNGEFGCYINRWRFLPVRNYQNPNKPRLIY